MIRLQMLFACLALAALACTELSEPTAASILSDALPVDGSTLATPALVGFADLGPDDALFLMPTSEDHSVYVRIRDGEPPLLFGTSCDVVSADPLPKGWTGGCLEYTSEGQRVFGDFPHGTVSN